MDRIDSIFREGLADDSGIVFDAIHWESLRLSLRRKRRRRLLWWSLASLVGAGLVLWSAWPALQHEAASPWPSNVPAVPEQLQAPPMADVRSAHEELPSALTDGKDAQSPARQQLETSASGVVSTTTDQGHARVPVAVEVAATPRIGRAEAPGTSGLARVPDPSVDHVPAWQQEQMLASPAVLARRDFQVVHDDTYLVDASLWPQANDFRWAGQTTAVQHEKMSHTIWGWTGTLFVNPALAQQATPLQGLMLGATIERAWGSHVAAGIRPSLQIRGDEGGFSQFQQVTTFGFAAQQQTYGVRAQQLQFISLPVYLALGSGRHSIELGMSFNLLLAARGTVQRVEISGQRVLPTDDLVNGWIETDQMRRFSTHALVGYRYMISANLRAGITTFFAPGPIYPGLPNHQSQRLHAQWYPGWQLTYLLR